MNFEFLIFNYARAYMESLLGEIITKIDGLQVGSEEVTFHFESGKTLIMRHEQCRCEDVRIKDIVGDPLDLIGHPLTVCRKSSYAYKKPILKENLVQDIIGYASEPHTWTFYRFATIRGYVTLHWLGIGNGYPSKEVETVIKYPIN
jgi:hypothetical protein